MNLLARLLKPEEAGMAIDWLRSTPENMFDERIFGYPGTMTFCVENGSPLLVMPLQPCFFMDALGKKPGITKRDMAYALVEMIGAIKKFSHGVGIREVFFYCRERTVSAQAPNFGFEIVCEDKERGITLFRMKT